MCIRDRSTQSTWGSVMCLLNIGFILRIVKRLLLTSKRRVSRGLMKSLVNTVIRRKTTISSRNDNESSLLSGENDSVQGSSLNQRYVINQSHLGEKGLQTSSLS
eukprot:TRINITY_DN30760_c0_g2_i1.p1 TRINITY_DN30760_c0_g2~~TRINITY_DN30760_c0_g2_i1.p1  ORF type:complete len:104 (-),score=7.91 TRINITY_DN30760_c0_g2_i1:242-553(-)